MNEHLLTYRPMGNKKKKKKRKKNKKKKKKKKKKKTKMKKNPLKQAELITSYLISLQFKLHVWTNSCYDHAQTSLLSVQSE